MLFLLDEFAALGHLRPVETAVGLLRGHGVKIWPILQDLSQIKAHYPRSWESFLANAGAIQVFGTNDQGTAEYFSKMTGTRTIDAPSDGPTGMSVSQVARPLFTPDEIRRIDEGSILLFIQQHPVYEVGKPRYYQLAHLTGLYDPNPYRQPSKPYTITEADVRGK